ncbi:Binding-protein-dependent transport systems inner membrane component [Candidatus Desulfosporosinus infrequens]|uniref:Binding-protein-dependent transport systems inner membrane component n=1 Tax=Candidatus Desulfosporosinus infrequens TaxID=2043169 RepID=A0A2U3LB85_9FIRM|nr:Binding-protein-dependent transport systems inner membrane component [Candidatus Desulfosporosinus infrequens]
MFGLANNTFQEIKRLKSEPLLLLMILAMLSIMVLFVLWPIIKVVTFPKPQDYLRVITNSIWYQAALNSLFMMVISTLSCTTVAFIFSYTLVRLDVPLKRLFRLITILPILSPPFIVALSYILLFGVQGLIAKNILHLNIDIYGWRGLWFVQTVTFFPYAYTVINSTMRSIPPNLEYAAFNLGANRWSTFRDVFFPLCRPGVAGGALLAAMNVLADFGNPMMIGGNYRLLPTEAYLQISGFADISTAAILATELLVPAAGLFMINRYWVGRRSYVTITGKEITLPPTQVPWLIKWGMFGLCLMISLVILSIYGVLFYGSFTKLWGYNWSFSLGNMVYVWDKGREIFNSIKFAFLSSVLAGVFAILLAYIVQRKQVGINRQLDFLAILPAAIPGVFLGLGFAMAFNEKPLALSGTEAIMVLGLMFWNIPTCYSTSTAGMQQIGNSVEEASLNLGANHWRTFINILLPLLNVSFVSGIIVAFLRSLTALSVVIFIYSAHTVVSTISILGLVQNGDWGGAAALTTVLVAIAFVVLGIVYFIFKKQGKSLEL